MPVFDFTVRLNGPLDDDDYDRLYEAGFDDSTPGNEDGRGFLLVSRDAPNLPNAIASAVVGLRNAGYHPVGIQSDDDVSLKTVASRLNRSYESVRLLARGERGPGGFPNAISHDGWALYSWAAVSKWFAFNLGEGDVANEDQRFAAAANHILVAHEIVGDDEQTWTRVKELI